MRKIAIPALLFPVLLAMTIPVGSQTRPRRVSEPVDNSTTLARAELARADERPRVAREGAAPALEQPRREGSGGGNRLLRGLLGMGIEMGAGRLGRSSCSPSRGVFLGMPSSRRY